MRGSVHQVRHTAGILALLAALVVSAVATAQTDAGTLIVNQARALVRGDVVVPSNQVTTVVRTVCGVRVLPLDDPNGNPSQSLTLTHGGSAAVPFRVINTGNATHTFGIEVRRSGTAWEPLSTVAYRDLRQGGQVDPGDPAIEAIELEVRQHDTFVLEVTAPEQGSGTIDLSITIRCDATTPTAPGTASDATTTARLRLEPRTSPALASTIQLTPSPDAEASVLVKIEQRNFGGAGTGPLDLHVPLDTLAPCLTLAADGRETRLVEFDGATVQVRTADGWLTLGAFEQRVRDGLLRGSDALELRVARSDLAASQSSLVAFTLAIDRDTCGDQSTIVATERGSTLESRIVAHLAHDRQPQVSLRHVPDSSATPVMLPGQTRCFEFALHNTSSVDDALVLTLAHDLDPHAATLRAALRNRYGLPLEPIVDLPAGARRIVQACISSDDDLEPFELTLVANSLRRGATVSAGVRVGGTYAGPSPTLHLTSNPASVAFAGDRVRFDVRLVNPLPTPLTNVRLRFEPLGGDDSGNPRLVWHDGDDGFAYDTVVGSVSWALAEIPAGADHRASFELRLRDDLADDTRIATTVGAHADQLGDLLQSEVLALTVWSSELLVSPSVTPVRVRPGEPFTLTVEVGNPSTSPIHTRISLTPPSGATLHGARAADGGDEPLPADAAATRHGDAPGGVTLVIPAGGVAHAYYDFRTAAAPPAELVGVVHVNGMSTSGVVLRSIDSAFVVPVDWGALERGRGVLVGHVFIDRHDDGRYRETSDGLSGVRVVLPDGRQAITDAAGRFAFRDLPSGWWRVQLDPATLPAELAESPTRTSASAHRVLVHGVTRLDVPVQAPEGRIDLERSSEHRHGPLTITQDERPLGGMLLRVVTVRTSAPLAGLTLRWLDADGIDRGWVVGDLDDHARRSFLLPATAAATEPEATWLRD